VARAGLKPQHLAQTPGAISTGSGPGALEPGEYVGIVVPVNESAPHCEMVQQGKVIVHRLNSAPQRSDGIRPLSRVARMAERTKCVASPGFDPAFGQLGEMMERELAQHEAASQVEVPEYPAIGTAARPVPPAAPVPDRKRAYRAPGAGGEKRKPPMQTSSTNR
jgi:hypothetical protein